jgi:very-short-patch-repair endonuclease
VKTPPTQPSVTVPRKRRVDPRRRQGVTVRWRDLPGDSCDGHVTTRVQTVLDCARDLPFDEALAVADSALRDRYVDRAMLLGTTDELPVRVRRRVRRVIEAADSLADNPFESVLRAFALEAGLDVSPQLTVQAGTSTFYPDLVDTGRRCVLEAESFAHHGHRKALRKDCRRYTLLAVHGWRVIRFSWEDVMHDPTYVRACLQQLARDGRTDRRCPA